MIYWSHEQILSAVDAGPSVYPMVWRQRVFGMAGPPESGIAFYGVERFISVLDEPSPRLA